MSTGFIAHGPDHDLGLVKHRNGSDQPIRDFGAYSVTFDDRELPVGATVEAGPGVRLTRRC